MHVEVNEQNIALYELEKLTGNPKDVLLQAAREAEVAGHTLYCRIPDELRHVNAFEHYDSVKAPDVVTTMDSDGNIIRIDDDGVETVLGEVVEDDE